jgi:hypothetical protein
MLLMMIDGRDYGGSVDFAFMQSEDQATHATMMTALREEAVAKHPSWKGPSCVRTDKCVAEINAAGISASQLMTVVRTTAALR